MMSTVASSPSLLWVLNIFSDNDSAQPHTDTIIISLNFNCLHVFLTDIISRLYQNEIVDIHDKALKGLNRLKILDISQNKLINAPTLSYVQNTLEELN